MTRFPEIGSEMDDLGSQANGMDAPDIIKGRAVDENKTRVLIDKDTGLVTFQRPISERPQQKVV